MEAKILELYLVTQSDQENPALFLEKIDQACQAGVTLVQLREKNLNSRTYYELAVRVKQITDSYKIPLIIDDRLDICLAVDAAGVHMGDEDLPVSIARALLGDKWLGISAKSLKRALEAQREGADYLGVGAIFPTKTKVTTKQTSIETLKDICSYVDLPVVAIGGLNTHNLFHLQGTGIAGVAMVSEIMESKDILQKVKELRTLTREILLEKKGSDDNE